MHQTFSYNLKEFKMEVTYRCSLNCVHCSSDASPSNLQEMSRDDCLRILIEAAKMTANEVSFSGGEPLDWKHIFDAVKTAVRHNIKSIIYTSGNTDDFKIKAAHLKRLGASHFIFSLFGCKSQTHERITRISGSFDRTKTAMLAAISLGLKAEIHFVPMKTNYHELSDIVSLGKQLGSSNISILRFVPQGRASLINGYALNKIQHLELSRKIQELRKLGHKIRTGSPYNFLMINDKPGCLAAIDRLTISPDLRVFPCDAFKQTDVLKLVGTDEFTTLQNNSLSDCWRKSSFLNSVRKYISTPFVAPCISCKFLDKCFSGCLAQKLLVYGTLAKQPDPDCLILEP